MNDKQNIESIVGANPNFQTETIVLMRGNVSASITPFKTLDDAFVAAKKVSKLVFPEFEKSAENDLSYISSLHNSVSALNLAKPESRFDALVDVLSLTLMGFDENALNVLKSKLNKSLASVAQKKVNDQTYAFLKATGFTHDLNA